MAARPISTVSIVGARPQFVKLSPVSHAMSRARRPIEDRIVHTGQHYDDAMSRVFFHELGIPSPVANLGIGSGPQGQQTGRMLEALERYLLAQPPDAVIVYGDTNSTLAGALAAAKLHIPVLHVEAGLRSFNRRMPEELNRITTDHLSEVLFAPTPTAVGNLKAEGLQAKTVLSGDVMYDAVLFNAEIALRKSDIVRELGILPGHYGVATIHRAENTVPGELRALLRTVNDAAAKFGRIVLPMHPRTAAVLKDQLQDWKPVSNLMITAPLSYLDMLVLVQGARWVLTDSGGLQKEAFFLKCPCVTLRNETEWLETLSNDANRIAGSDGSGLLASLEALSALTPRSLTQRLTATDGPFGAGHAADRIALAVCDLCEASL